MEEYKEIAYKTILNMVRSSGIIDLRDFDEAFEKAYNER